jgi:hypothetical protein
MVQALFLVLQPLPFGALGGKFHAHRYHRGTQAGRERRAVLIVFVSSSSCVCLLPPNIVEAIPEGKPAQVEKQNPRVRQAARPAAPAAPRCPCRRICRACWARWFRQHRIEGDPPSGLVAHVLVTK